MHLQENHWMITDGKQVHWESTNTQSSWT